MKKKYLLTLFTLLNLSIISLLLYYLVLKDDSYSSNSVNQYNQLKKNNIENRWYSEKQVVIGSKIFTQNCQICHREKAASIKNWQQSYSDGSYPPPPLDGTAHTWHHSMKVLLKTINDGGTVLGGKMPAFKNVLTEEEKKSVIAYIQSLWPEEIYKNWAQRNR